MVTIFTEEEVMEVMADTMDTEDMVEVMMDMDMADMGASIKKKSDKVFCNKMKERRE